MSSYFSHYIRHPPSDNIKNDVEEFIHGFYGIDCPEPPFNRYPYHCLFIRQVPSYAFYKHFHSLAGDTINAVTKKGNTPLHYLCNRNDLDHHYAVFELMLRYLTKRGFFSRLFGTPIPDNFRFAVNKNGVTPLMLLVGHSGNTRCVQLMLEYHARVTDRDNDKNTVYHHMFLYHGQVTSLSTYRLIHAMIPNMIHSANKQGNTPLHLLCAHHNVDKHLSLLESVLRNKADINAKNTRGVTPFMYLIANPQNTKSLELLLHYHPKVYELDNQRHTAYHFIFAKGRITTTAPRYQYLHHKLSKVMNAQDSYGRTPLHWFCSQPNRDSHIELFKQMLKNKLDYSICDNNGKTPVMYLLSERGNTKCIMALLHLQQNLDGCDKDNNTIYHYLFRQNNFLPLSIYKDLHENHIGKYLTSCNDKNETPLHILCNQPDIDQHLDLLKFLLDHGADLSIQNYQHMTPLMLLVCQPSSTRAVKILIEEYHADYTLLDIFGNTTYHLMFARHLYIAPIETYKYIHEIFPQGLHMVNRRNNTPLHLFCFHASADLHIDVLEAMIANNPPKYIKNWIGLTPYGCIHIGSSKTQCIRLLKQASFATSPMQQQDQSPSTSPPNQQQQQQQQQTNSDSDANDSDSNSNHNPKNLTKPSLVVDPYTDDSTETPSTADHIPPVSPIHVKREKRKGSLIARDGRLSPVHIPGVQPHGGGTNSPTHPHVQQSTSKAPQSPNDTTAMASPKPSPNQKEHETVSAVTTATATTPKHKEDPVDSNSSPSNVSPSSSPSPSPSPSPSGSITGNSLQAPSESCTSSVTPKDDAIPITDPSPTSPVHTSRTKVKAKGAANGGSKPSKKES